MRDDGGSAFPSAEYFDARYEDYRPPEYKGGMTLRQWYKGNERSDPPIDCASDGADFLGIPVAEYTRESWAKVIAKWRGMVADAMIAEDEEGEKHDSK